MRESLCPLLDDRAVVPPWALPVQASPCVTPWVAGLLAPVVASVSPSVCCCRARRRQSWRARW